MVTPRTRRRIAGAVSWVVVLGLAGCAADPAEESGDPNPASSPTSSPSDTPSASAGVLELTVDAPTASQAKCMVPNAEVLATQDTAFEGTVTEVADGTATLSVEQWFSDGAGVDTVSVSTPSEQLQDLLVAVDFQEGRTYLVSSLDGRVSLCGFTAESTPQLEQLYAAAFAG